MSANEHEREHEYEDKNEILKRIVSVNVSLSVKMWMGVRMSEVKKKQKKQVCYVARMESGSDRRRQNTNWLYLETEFRRGILACEMKNQNKR